MADKNQKEAYAAKAKLHTENMQKKYAGKIQTAIQETEVYTDRVTGERNWNSYPETEFVCNNQTTTEAILQFAGEEGRIAALNFASYKNPGGNFIGGSMAQEEALCQDSFLYNVLVEKKDYYEYNNQHKNHALYTNRALYTKDVLFQEKALCDIITCAAPNWGAARRQGIKAEENHAVLKERIRFILEIAAKQNVSTLILGAYGCGVFRQEPKEVAQVFRECLLEMGTCFRRVVFAIPDKNSRNYQGFLEVWNDRL